MTQGEGKGARRRQGGQVIAHWLMLMTRAPLVHDGISVFKFTRAMTRNHSRRREKKKVKDI